MHICLTLQNTKVTSPSFEIYNKNVHEKNDRCMLLYNSVM